MVVTANLYLPSKITGRIPAIVVVHSHHFPKVQGELQDLGMTWAGSGVAVVPRSVLQALHATKSVRQHALPRRISLNRTSVVWSGQPSTALAGLLSLLPTLSG